MDAFKSSSSVAGTKRSFVVSDDSNVFMGPSEFRGPTGEDGGGSPDTDEQPPVKCGGFFPRITIPADGTCVFTRPSVPMSGFSRATDVPGPYRNHGGGGGDDSETPLVLEVSSGGGEGSSSSSSILPSQGNARSVMTTRACCSVEALNFTQQVAPLCYTMLYYNPLSRALGAIVPGAPILCRPLAKTQTPERLRVQIRVTNLVACERHGAAVTLDVLDSRACLLQSFSLHDCVSYAEVTLGAGGRQQQQQQQQQQQSHHRRHTFLQNLTPTLETAVRVWVRELLRGSDEGLLDGVTSHVLHVSFSTSECNVPPGVYKIMYEIPVHCYRWFVPAVSLPPKIRFPLPPQNGYSGVVVQKKYGKRGADQALLDCLELPETAGGAGASYANDLMHALFVHLGVSAHGQKKLAAPRLRIAGGDCVAVLETSYYHVEFFFEGVPTSADLSKLRTPLGVYETLYAAWPSRSPLKTKYVEEFVHAFQETPTDAALYHLCARLDLTLWGWTKSLMGYTGLQAFQADEELAADLGEALGHWYPHGVAVCFSLFKAETAGGGEHFSVNDSKHLLTTLPHGRWARVCHLELIKPPEGGRARNTLLSATTQGACAAPARVQEKLCAAHEAKYRSRLKELPPDELPSELRALAYAPPDFLTTRTYHTFLVGFGLTHGAVNFVHGYQTAGAAAARC